MEFLSQATVLAAAAVLIVEEILKLKIVPVTFANKYPVLTNFGLSVIATIAIVKPILDWANWQTLLAQTIMVFVVAAITYNMTLDNSQDVQKIAGGEPVGKGE